MKGDQHIWANVFKKQADIVYREIAGEYILVPVSGKLADMQRIFMLNPVAEHIWKELDGIRSLAEISDGVPDAFAVNKDDARADVMAFIRELLDAELICEV